MILYIVLCYQPISATVILQNEFRMQRNKYKNIIYLNLTKKSFCDSIHANSKLNKVHICIYENYCYFLQFGNNLRRLNR